MFRIVSRIVSRILAFLVCGVLCFAQTEYSSGSARTQYFPDTTNNIHLEMVFNYNVTNINTDQLLPARYLKWPRSAGLGKVLLQDLRFDAEGREQPDFPLNRSEWREAKIIVAARNFG